MELNTAIEKSAWMEFGGNCEKATEMKSNSITLKRVGV